MNSPNTLRRVQADQRINDATCALIHFRCDWTIVQVSVNYLKAHCDRSCIIVNIHHLPTPTKQIGYLSFSQKYYILGYSCSTKKNEIYDHCKMIDKYLDFFVKVSSKYFESTFTLKEKSVDKRKLIWDTLYIQNLSLTVIRINRHHWPKNITMMGPAVRFTKRRRRFCLGQMSFYTRHNAVSIGFYACMN